MAVMAHRPQSLADGQGPAGAIDGKRPRKIDRSIDSGEFPPVSHLPTDARGFDFRSDNVAGVAPEVIAALAAANHGAQSSYGEDAISLALERRLADIFEHELAVFPVATGSAANALALASLVPGWGAVLCHEEAHIATDECGAPEFFTQGAKLIPLGGAHGKISAATIETRLSRAARGVHHVQPAAVSITQATEAGACYRPEEVALIAQVCRTHRLKLHMDGARFANAVASLGCSPAEATWKAGVDALSFGLTKNGAMAAEAVIFFDPAAGADFGFRRKRAGHLFSKMRFASAQFEAQLQDGLWLRLAGHANAMARRLASGLAALPGITLLHPVEANELFVAMPEDATQKLEAAGYRFYRWDADAGPCIRLVTAFDTAPAHIDGLIAAAEIALGMA
jgi:threonine aldolase